ncbi:hypothetical protein [Paeniglutamicibacter sulfureus]|uniref:Uncharacterized protein n=1 Tax=Paeniglutamicibacter sulfureus TaxID=43666 RepID=A0ABU2BIS6_9MICC|nr:hypothetical protein [Paeniglutamicibacter sulfureus]MDO2934359.1 hypothetical protein [Paeniglutamicibacter sulfureus]MDR7358554.1 hypothetical protein [Paeniglutamicibacter sulfureus]
MADRGVPPGSASLSLLPGVSFLNDAESVFTAMLEGWQMRQRGGRNLKESSVRGTVSQISQFQAYINDWPWNWNWTAADFDEVDDASGGSQATGSLDDSHLPVRGEGVLQLLVFRALWLG